MTGFAFGQMSSFPHRLSSRKGEAESTTAFSCKLYFEGSAVGKEFQEQHLLVQGSGCIQLASVLPQILCRKIRMGMEVVCEDPVLPQILPVSPLPTSFFSSGLRFALKYSLSRIEGDFLYICLLSIFPSLPAFPPFSLTTTGKLQIFLL